MILRPKSRLILLICIVCGFSACFTHKMMEPELKIHRKAISEYALGVDEKGCNLNESLINYKRFHTGRLNVSAPESVFYYAALCRQKYPHLYLNKKHNSSEYTEKILLLRATLCGNDQAAKNLEMLYNDKVEKMFSAYESNGHFYLKPVSIFSKPTHPYFPYQSITADAFCGYAETEFTATGIVLTPFIVVPAIIIGAPFLLLKGAVYVFSFGTINMF